MYTKELIELTIYKRLEDLPKSSEANKNLGLHLNSYTQILEVIKSEHTTVRNLITEFNNNEHSIHDNTIQETTNNIFTKQTKISNKDVTKQVEIIITDLMSKIQDNPSLEKNFSYHALVYISILRIVHSQNTNLLNKIGKLHQKKYQNNLTTLK